MIGGSSILVVLPATQLLLDALALAAFLAAILHCFELRSTTMMLHPFHDLVLDDDFRRSSLFDAFVVVLIELLVEF